MIYRLSDLHHAGCDDDVVIDFQWERYDESGMHLSQYFRGVRMQDSSLEYAHVIHPGRVVDFNIVSGICIVSQLMSSVFTNTCPNDVQLVPVRLELPGKWFAVNVLNLVDCLDDAHSQIDYYPQGHAQCGEPRGVRRLVLRQPRIPDYLRIFRIERWNIGVYVTEEVRDAIRERKPTGVTCDSVELSG